jgi:hypothetical protein
MSPFSNANFPLRGPDTENDKKHPVFIRLLPVISPAKNTFFAVLSDKW